MRGPVRVWPAGLVPTLEDRPNGFASFVSAGMRKEALAVAAELEDIIENHLQEFLPEAMTST